VSQRKDPLNFHRSTTELSLSQTPSNLYKYTTQNGRQSIARLADRRRGSVAANPHHCAASVTLPPAEERCQRKSVLQSPTQFCTRVFSRRSFARAQVASSTPLTCILSSNQNPQPGYLRNHHTRRRHRASSDPPPPSIALRRQERPIRLRP
jgi:hypothetical protein